MSKDETMECVDCSGRGFRGVLGGLCPTCNGTGIETTGKFLGTLPSTPDPVTDEPHEPTITTTQGDAPSVVTGNGLRYVYAPGHDSGATVTDERDATIAEQAAEIERLTAALTLAGEQYGQFQEALLAVDRLKAERDTLRSALEIAAARSDSQSASIAYFEQESVSHDAALKEVTTERDQLRLEIEALKDERFEAMDRYAALEAERDELRRRLDIHGGTITKLQDDWHLYRITIANLEVERDTQVEQIQRLRENLSATGAELRESEARWKEEACRLAQNADHHREKAEKCLAVIRAKDAEIAALGQAWKTSMATGEAMQEAGLKFRHVSTEIPPFATEDTES